MRKEENFYINNFDYINSVIINNSELIQIKEHIINIFFELTEINIKNNEFILINDPNDSKNIGFPKLIEISEPLIIGTCVLPIKRDWVQFIFQFSHELTHYIIKCYYKKNKFKYLHWFEETICETMSLFVLKKIYENWSSIGLSNTNKDYDNIINNYLNKLLIKNGSDLKKCMNIIDLSNNIENIFINTYLGYKHERPIRNDEINILYNIFIENQNLINILFNYTEYIQDNGLLIDFDIWIKKNNEYKYFLDLVKVIQPDVV